MPSNSLCGPKLPFFATRQIAGLREPMKTRAMFYLEQLSKRRESEGQELIQADLNQAIGRAYRDHCEDGEVEFDPAETAAAIADAQAGQNFISLSDPEDAA